MMENDGLPMLWTILRKTIRKEAVALEGTTEKPDFTILLSQFVT